MTTAGVLAQFGRNLRGRLAVLGWSATALGKLAGVHSTQITRIMSGPSLTRDGPTLRTLVKLADAADCELELVLRPRQRLRPQPRR